MNGLVCCILYRNADIEIKDSPFSFSLSYLFCIQEIISLDDT